MKIRFLPLFFVMFLIFSACGGDDPVTSDMSDKNQNEESEGSENVTPDSDHSSGDDADSSTPDTVTDKDEENGGGDASENETDKDDADSETDDNGGDTDEDNSTSDSDNFADDDQTESNETDSDTSDNDEITEDTDVVSDIDSEQNDDEPEELPDNDGELTVELPYNGAPVDLTVTLIPKINKVDILLLVDVGHTSMSTAHENLKANKDAFINGIRAKISDPAFGLVNFGLFGENVYSLAQSVTTDENLLKNQIDAIVPKTASTATDLKKRYHTHALWEAASGEADYEQVAHQVSGTTQYSSINIPAVDCSGQEGTIGGACFREGAMPLFIMATNSAFNDLSYENFGEWKQGEKKTKQKAADKMNEINAKFIGFSLATSNLPQDLGYISEKTNSLTLSNENFVISETSDNWATKIAEAVINLKENIKLGVKAEFKHVDNGYGIGDTTEFIKSYYPDAVANVKPGTAKNYNIKFENKIHENTTCEPHIFYVTIELSGEGLLLDSRNIKIVVPAKGNCPEQH